MVRKQGPPSPASARCTGIDMWPLGTLPWLGMANRSLFPGSGTEARAGISGQWLGHLQDSWCPWGSHPVLPGQAMSEEGRRCLSREKSRQSQCGHQIKRGGTGRVAAPQSGVAATASSRLTTRAPSEHLALGQLALKLPRGKSDRLSPWQKDVPTPSPRGGLRCPQKRLWWERPSDRAQNTMTVLECVPGASSSGPGGPMSSLNPALSLPPKRTHFSGACVYTRACVRVCVCRLIDGKW